MTTRSYRSRPGRTVLAAGLTLALVAAACSGDDDNSGSTEAPADTTATTDDAPVETDAPETEAPSTEPPAETTTTEPPPTITEDRAYYILPPGNYGGLPTNDDSTDQLALYDGLTPLRGDVTDADLDEFFLPEDFEPIGETFEEPTGRAGTTIIYDEFGVPHITGETREDMAFGAGWVTARDRGLLFDLGRGAARVAVADVPGIDAFSLVTEVQPFTLARRRNNWSPTRSS